jgi:hypothetical protein
MRYVRRALRVRESVIPRVLLVLVGVALVALLGTAPAIGSPKPYSLRFVAQPSHAQVNQTITSTAFAPAGPSVTVEMVDALGQPVLKSLPVTVGIGRNPGSGTLRGTKTVRTSEGLASFSTLSINGSGQGYELVASNAQTGSVISGRFNIEDVAVSCAEDVTCAGTLPLRNTHEAFGGGSTARMTALQGPFTDTDTGMLTISRSAGLDCAGYTELTASNDVVLFDFSGLDREKRAVTTIDESVLSEIPEPSLEDCFGAPYTFATKPGTPLEVNEEYASADYLPGPYPPPEYKGLLPDCGEEAVLDDPNTPGVSGPTIPHAGSPCVIKRIQDDAGNGVISSRLPSVGDPRRRS